MSTRQRFLSFAFIGGLGFIVEAVIVTVLTTSAGWPAWQARGPSFLTAVLVTWIFNRRHTFRGYGPRRTSAEAVGYLAIQAVGAATNLLMFGTCVLFIPRFASLPVIPLAIGAAAGFAVNYGASSALLYPRPRHDGASR